MEDSEIIALYFDRNETAIKETDKKYGKVCHKIAFNILSLKEDSEECVNETYLKVWNLIPPERPKVFVAWLGKIVRNTALGIYTKLHAKKRYNGMNVMLEELEDCIPSGSSLENEFENKEISKAISNWLNTLSTEDRYIFIRRYWYGDSVNETAKKLKISAQTLSQRLYRIRIKLKNYLEQEGINV